METVRTFIISSSGTPRSGIAVGLSHTVDVNGIDKEMVLAIRQTDHAGFISFNDAVKPSYRSLRLFPIASPESGIDLDVKSIPKVIPLKIPDTIPASPTGSFPTGSCGDVSDAIISPNSFAGKTSVIGNSDCDLFLPGAQAERVYTYRQLAMRDDPPERLKYAEGDCFVYTPEVPDPNSTVPDNFDPPPPPDGPCYRKGLLLEYTATWCALGHALGEIAYSLPLAPCESVKLATVDWSRDDRAERRETTEQKESLSHDQRRDRVIEETVEASLKQSQRGFSVTGGASLGGVVSVGAGYSSSTGETDLHSQNTQSLADAVQQASAATRGLYSTVIVQASQRESDSVQTRTVTNNNHCHAMTVLYYEVLRRYLVRIELSKERDLILVQFDMPDFDAKSALCKRWLLEPILLERRLASTFDALVRVEFGTDPPDPSIFTLTPLPTQPVTRFKVTVQTGEEATDSKVYFFVSGLDGSELYRFELDIPDEGDFEEGQIGIYHGRVFGEDWSPNDISEIGLQFDEDFVGDTWQVAKVIVHYKTDGIDVWQLLYDSTDDSENDLPKTLEGNGLWFRPVLREAPAGISTEEDRARKIKSAWDRDIKQGERLLHHLNCNKPYYYRRIWEGEDPGSRAILLAKLAYRGGRLLDAIENRVVAVLGDTIAFPLQGEDDTHDELEKSEPVIKLVDLPTRGLFAEAKLSNCNVCEEKDITKYWDWSESPCKDCGPEIAPVTLGSRDRATDTTPTAFATPIVNITNPPTAPDPSGLGAALQLLGRADVFRNMSMSSEVSELVSDISSGAISLEQARIRARQIENNDMASTEVSGSSATRGMSPRTAHDAIQVTRNSMAHGDVSEGDGDAIISDILKKTVPPDPEKERLLGKGGGSDERIWFEANPVPRAEAIGDDSLLLWNFPINNSVANNVHSSAIRAFLERNGLAFLTNSILRIEGRASTSGDPIENEALSYDRALGAYSTVLRTDRVADRNIIVDGFGSSIPLEPTDTPEGMARNRSVLLTIDRVVVEPYTVEDREEKWRYAREYLESRVGEALEGGPDVMWTPTGDGMIRIVPRNPANLTIGPEYGNSVPERPICGDRPASSCMPNPKHLTIKILGEMLEKRNSLESGILTNTMIREEVDRFINFGRRAVNREMQLLRQLAQYILATGGGASLNEELERFNAAVQQWFENDPTCIRRYIE